MNAPDLAGARVLVTGADGFIGSHLAERLVREGARVRALCLYTSNGSRGWLEESPRDVRDEIEFVLGDIRDAASVEHAVTDTDVVFHLAALIAIPYSYEAPASFIETNVLGTFNVLEAARRTGVASVVHTSTSEVYGTPDRLPITEDHPLKAQSPYSATKIGADQLCLAWACSFGLPVVILRPFNTFGPRQSARAVIPTVLGQVLAGATTLRLGSLHPRRDFTYVSDTVDGFVRAARGGLAPGEVVQLGTGVSLSVAELVERAAKVLGADVDVVEDAGRVRPDTSEVQVLVSDPSKAARLLGWAPVVDFEEGLVRTVDWLRGRVDHERATHYSR